jgi:Brp/Blh family beta-carotene 15,15'-monooxygenase
MPFSNKKILVHHFFFLLLSAILIFCYSEIPDINNLSPFDFPPLLSWSFILIGSLGLGHGALDGKIIWNVSSDLIIKLKIYLIYLSIVLIALFFWIAFPSLGLITLLVMSIIHFGESDMQGDQINLIEYLSWGYFVTFMPLIFKPDDVNNIFKDLSGLQINHFIYSCCFILFILSIGTLIRLIIKKKYIAIPITMVSMTVLGYLLHPLVWFAYYFCFFHGIRSMIHFFTDFKKDILWIFLFSIPVLSFWLHFIFFVKISINSIIFPTLFALTVAHMLLKTIIKKSLTQSVN